MNLNSERVEQFYDDCFAAGLKDPLRFLLSKMPQTYGYLKGAFPRGILPTDVDGEVELNGFFLRFEFKHQDALRDGRVPKGQKRYLERLVVDKDFTVLLVGTNELGEPTLVDIWFRTKAGLLKIDRREFTDGRAELHQLCSRWASSKSSTGETK